MVKYIYDAAGLFLLFIFFSMKINGPPCYETNVVEDTPKFEHHNLSLLEMKGFARLRTDLF
jgi:hypothetical protein